MSVNLEQIEMLRARANVSYGEAKELLEKCNYNVVDALIELEKQSKVNAPKTEAATETCCGGTVKKIFKLGEKLFHKGNETKFVISKADQKIVDLPVNVVILSTIIAAPITVFGVIGALVTNHKIRFSHPSGEDLKINQTMDKISNVVSNVSSQVTDAINK